MIPGIGQVGATSVLATGSRPRGAPLVVGCFHDRCLEGAVAKLS